MAVTATSPRTIETAERAAVIARARARLLATAIADALSEAKTGHPGACERITGILTAAREQHLNFLQEPTA